MPDGQPTNIKAEYEEARAFVDELANKAKTVSEKNGELRSRLNQIIEQTGWNKTAFADIRKIDRMSPEARADYLRSFEQLFDAFLSYAWRDEMQDMVDGIESEDEE